MHAEEPGVDEINGQEEPLPRNPPCLRAPAGYEYGEGRQQPLSCSPFSEQGTKDTKGGGAFDALPHSVIGCDLEVQPALVLRGS